MKTGFADSRRRTFLGRLLLALSLLLVVSSAWRLLRATWLAPTDGWIAGGAADALLLGSAGLTLGLLGLWLLRSALTAGRSTPATFLTPEEERRVLEAIASFESRTSGEIRVHLEDRVTGDLLEQARRTFEEIGMTRTAERNGVLIFVAVASRRFAILGDEGIDDRVEEGFWDSCVERIRRRFAEGRFADGLVEGIELAGAALAEHFPVREDDVNELPDGISRRTGHA
ncbi:MAG: TPM domain-containing protein [Acidobacteriota bacterium]|nr:TPM domain-containing protein [Acidobacteriota bacterium]MDQ7087226.1 TPM domain-containing protein [Acidobacteriota bacterium]